MTLIFMLGSGTSFRARVRVRYVGMCSWEIRFQLESGEVPDVRVSAKLDLTFLLWGGLP